MNFLTKKLEEIKKRFVLLILCSILLFPVRGFSQEKITFDGYWWGTISDTQKLGYIQGFMDGTGTAFKNAMLAFVEHQKTTGAISPETAENLKTIYSLWNPFGHNFGYYFDRIEGYYKTTGNMSTSVEQVMLDLMTPIPNP